MAYAWMRGSRCFAMFLPHIIRRLLCLEYPISLIEPEAVGVGISASKNIRGAIAVEISDCQAVPFGIVKALTGLLKHCLPIVPPNHSLLKPGDQGILVSITI